MKKKLILFLMLLSLFVIGCTQSEKQIGDNTIVYIDTGTKEILVNAEVVDEFEERMQGLMFREYLDENDGMLFIFEQQEYLSFWMKNTLIPLDMIFISENLEIVDIHHAIPCESDPCRSYTSKDLALYVLEVNEGFTDENNIEIGDKIIIN